MVKVNLRHDSKPRSRTRTLLVFLLLLTVTICFYDPGVRIRSSLLDIVFTDNPTTRTTTSRNSTSVHHEESEASSLQKQLQPKDDVRCKKKQPIPQHVCRENVIVYLAQKNHSSYNRDSYGLLLKSLDLLFENYLNDYYESASLLIFHTGDFREEDLTFLEQHQAPRTYGTIHLVDISNTSYWQLPPFLEGETHVDWYLPDYTVGYRHMMRWYALKLYDWLRDSSSTTGNPCNYKYVMRMDEESFIHSPIRYDIFQFMQQRRYQYGFRLCSFEMRHLKPLWKEYVNYKGKDAMPQLQRPKFIHQDLCGFYNNWFIMDLDWIFQPNVQDWLQWLDSTGYIYRKRVNDLVIHTAAVYAFLDPTRIHRFLDFTYQHFTNYNESGCPLWGAIAGGYKDPNAVATIQEYIDTQITANHCPRPNEKKRYAPRIMWNLSIADQSPTYHHLNTDGDDFMIQTLPEVAAGHVDLKHVGVRSG